MMARGLIIDAIGDPAPKGSKRAFVVKGRAIMAEDSKRTLPWMHLIRAEAEKAIARLPAEGRALFPLRAAIRLEVSFRMRRPKSHLKKDGSLRAGAPIHPIAVRRNDLDKLLRCIMDALTDIAWADDSQIMTIEASKAYAIASPPGARISILSRELLG